MNNTTTPENSDVTQISKSASLITPTLPERSASEPPAVSALASSFPSNGPAIPSQPSTLNAQPPSPANSDPLDLIRQLIPTSLRKRKFRADSFVAQLTKQQLATVIAWLQQHPVAEVQTKVAAAPPVGFGIHAATSALYRLRNMISNTELNHWIENAMDATCDILEADTSVNTAPMREALSLLLHSRVMTYLREQADPVSIDRLLSALTRLEKLKTHIAQRPNLINAPREKTTRHQVDLRITTHHGAATPITIQATHQSLPDAPPSSDRNLAEHAPHPQRSLPQTTTRISTDASDRVIASAKEPAEKSTKESACSAAPGTLITSPPEPSSAKSADCQPPRSARRSNVSACSAGPSHPAQSTA
jgi:hypothetical protein